MTAPILLSTVGSFGDLFPVLALAHALEARGQPARLALSPEDATRARTQGLDAIACGPTEADVSRLAGLDRDALARQVFRDPSPILTSATYPMLASLAADLAPEATRARAVAGTLLAMAAPLAAELADRPYIPLLLQPLLLRSALDPPRVPGFAPPMLRRPDTAAARAWNRLWLRVIDAEFRRRHGRDQARVRRELGLPPTRAVPVFGHPVPPVAQLGLWDPAVAPAPADRDVRLTGFPRLAPEGLPGPLAAFLESGPPPLVVTLGSVSHALGGDGFWAGAAALARDAGLRAVLLSGDVPLAQAGDIHATPYAPHDALFPHAAAVLHHGGIGTTGAACLAGIPQLIQPLGADQPDNAARIEALGVGRVIRGPAQARHALQDVLSTGTRAAARALAARLIPDGADQAAEALLQTVEARVR
ncbi:glycosyltransferase [Palleronia rufa]|uniref:glycosyltransferase n=1 Tax=Palleronia rufa TaxID=1530186 RepID=UPI00056C015E|nr:nucleotide disphospho-sugar-binding domain-containing protein [Palleronia rufa]